MRHEIRKYLLAGLIILMDDSRIQKIFDPAAWTKQLAEIPEDSREWFPLVPMQGPGTFEYHRRWFEKLKCFGSFKPFAVEDYLLWGKGEPESPAQTKIGGRALRCPDVPWPLGTCGGPIPFFSQINFTSCSKPHSNEKNLLLVFADIVEDVLVEFATEWYSLEDDELVPMKPPAGCIEWPRQVYHAEVFHHELCLPDTYEEIERYSALAGFPVPWQVAPDGCIIRAWDGKFAESSRQWKLLARFSSMNPVHCTQMAWLNGNEELPVTREQCEPLGPDMRPRRWFQLSVGTLQFDICIDECGEVRGYLTTDPIIEPPAPLPPGWVK